MYVSTICSYKILSNFDNFNTINEKFFWIVNNYVTYNLLKFRIDIFTETASFCVSIERKQKKANQNKLKRKTLYVSTMCSYKILLNFDNFNAINLKFLWIVDNYVTYNLYKFQIDSNQIEA